MRESKGEQEVCVSVIAYYFQRCNDPAPDVTKTSLFCGR